MHIVCPHCTTSYVIDLATLGATGRTVRCSRCKEVWLARPEDAIEPVVSQPAMAEASPPGKDSEGDAGEWDTLASDGANSDPPVVDSPSIASDFPADRSSPPDVDEADWQTLARHDVEGTENEPWLRQNWFRRLASGPARRTSGQSSMTLPIACTAMGALVAALLIWRADVVRLLPQTAGFYRMVGLDVNLRGLTFKDVKVTSETVADKPVLVIQGVIVGETRNPVELPRLRFSIRDARGAEIYAWNTVLEQTVLEPGDRASFTSRLASPPAEARSIDVRFFNKRDIAGGSA